MSSARKPFLTPDEYLAIERGADHKSEYLNGEMFAMTGAGWSHVVIVGNLARALGNAQEKVEPGAS